MAASPLPLVFTIEIGGTWLKNVERSLAFHGKNTLSRRETDGKKLNNAKAWTSDEDERLRELVISNISVIDIAADLGRTVKAVRARAHVLRIALGRSRFRIKASVK